MNQTEFVQQEVCNQTFNFRIPMALKKELTDRSQSTGEKPSDRARGPQNLPTGILKKYPRSVRSAAGETNKLLQ
jgi:hypothetical protein